MKEQEYNEEDPGEFKQLVAMLRTTDLSGKSKVREPLKLRLLSGEKEEKPSFFPWQWLFPAAATALAAFAMMFVLPHKKPGAPAYYQVPDAGYDIYADCGRQGLKDYLSAPRF